MRVFQSLLLAVLSLAACRTGSPRSPQTLRQAYVQAVRDNKPEAAYALLTPDVQQAVSPKVFVARWKANRKEQLARAKAAAELGDKDRDPVFAGTAYDEDGKVLEFVKVGDHYWISGGLPQTADTSTPDAAVRAFIAATRGTDFSAVEAVVDGELAEAMHEEWDARVRDILSALSKPGAFSLSLDLQHAELRYGNADHLIRLKQTTRGWRILDIR